MVITDPRKLNDKKKITRPPKPPQNEASYAMKARRALMNGRPPASELKTPSAALSVARTWLREIEVRIQDETNGQRPNSKDYFAVALCYVTPDLSALGFTPLLVPNSPKEQEDRVERMLTGNIAVGLLFGIADGSEMLMGSRAFLATRQTDAWLEELTRAVRSEMELDRIERG